MDHSQHHGEEREVSALESAQQGNEVSSLLKIIASNEAKNLDIIQKLAAVVKEMQPHLEKQRNIKNEVKNGIKTIEDALDGLRVDINATLQTVQKLKKLKRSATFAEVLSTPRSGGGNKRLATSPPLAPVGAQNPKKKKEEQKKTAPQEEWKEVPSKKKKLKGDGKTENKSVSVQKPEPKPEVTKGKKMKKKKKKTSGKIKPEAILLRPIQGVSYADVVGAVRKEVKPETCGAEITAVRRTQAGDVLLELKKGSAKSREALAEALKKVVTGKGTVRELVPRTTLEIRDLDCCATKEEVEVALREKLQDYAGSLVVGVTRPNARGQRLAIVTIDESVAAGLVEAARIKIGFVNCRIRPRKVVARCFRCLGYGHESRGCKGPDRSKCCYRCGAGEHKAEGCKAEAKCFLCAAKGEKPAALKHVAGSGACGAFREALKKASR